MSLLKLLWKVHISEPTATKASSSHPSVRGSILSFLIFFLCAPLFLMADLILWGTYDTNLAQKWSAILHRWFFPAEGILQRCSFEVRRQSPVFSFFLFRNSFFSVCLGSIRHCPVSKPTSVAWKQKQNTCHTTATDTFYKYCVLTFFFAFISHVLWTQHRTGK